MLQFRDVKNFNEVIATVKIFNVTKLLSHIILISLLNDKYMVGIRNYHA